MKQETSIPARPDLPFRSELATPVPKTHKLRWLILGGVGMFIVLAILGSILDLGEPGTRVASPDPITINQPVDSNMDAARFAWQTAITPAERAEICDYYNTPPVGITPPLVRAFDEGAGLGYAESERVRGALLAEEC